MKGREVYRSDTLLVRRIPAADRSRWVVTFDNHSIGEGFDRAGFGEAFLAREGVSAICILGRGNDWYQYPDMLAACAAARASIRARARVMTYGSSMGGYAALRFADALRAQAVLALSPQYSIDPAVVPWEFRWEQDSHRIDWQPELSGPIRCAATPYILYDPKGLDCRHVDLIECDVPGTAIAIPYAGHPVTTFLGGTGLLRPLVHGILDDTIDVATLRQQIKSRRSANATYLAGLANEQPKWRARTAVAIARRACEISPHDLAAHHALARALAAAGRTDEALRLHVEAVERFDRHLFALIAYADALIAAGDAAAAVPIAQEVVAKEPNAAHLRHWLAWTLDRAGALDEAIAQETIAVAMTPGSTLFRDALAAFEQKNRPVGRLRSAVYGGWRRRFSRRTAVSPPSSR